MKQGDLIEFVYPHKVPYAQNGDIGIMLLEHGRNSGSGIRIDVLTNGEIRNHFSYLWEVII